MVLGEKDAVHVFNIHLGTAFVERRHQGRRLSERDTGILHGAELTGAKIVLGDFNEWTSGLASKLLGSHLKSVDVKQAAQAARAPSPASCRSCTSTTSTTTGPLELLALDVHRTRKSLMASDHLPLVADFKYLKGVEPAIEPPGRGRQGGVTETIDTIT